MTNLPEIGTTLNQTALAVHIGRPASWIRSEGDFVTAMAANGHRETWARMEFQNHRCAGYKLMVRDPKIEHHDHFYEPGAYGVCRRCGDERKAHVASRTIRH